MTINELRSILDEYAYRGKGDMEVKFTTYNKIRISKPHKRENNIEIIIEDDGNLYLANKHLSKWLNYDTRKKIEEAYGN